MEVEKNENNNEIVIDRPGKESVNVKLADNTGKKSETSKRRVNRRRVRRFRGSLGRQNYIGSRNKSLRRRSRKDSFSNSNRRRQRGVGLRRRGVKIIIRNLTRNATNSDIKSVFEKIGPLRRCGINWNNLGESKGTAEVEYYYRRDAFKACRKLDYKSIRGVPIRLEMREGQKRIVLRRLRSERSNSLKRSRSSTTGGRRFRSLGRYNRTSSLRRRRRSISQRNSSRRRLSNRLGRRRDSSRGERKYKKYNN